MRECGGRSGGWRASGVLWETVEEQRHSECERRFEEGGGRGRSRAL